MNGSQALALFTKLFHIWEHYLPAVKHGTDEITVPMRLVGAPLIAEFAARRPDAKKDLDAWRLEVQASTWATPHELKARYPKASIIKGREVVFSIRHNRYRLHVTVDYQSGTVIVRRLGTHAEYDRWTF